MAMFARPENLRDSKIREYIWNPDEKLTKIFIYPVYQWHASTLHSRPAIVVKRNAWKVNQLAIGDGAGTGASWDMEDKTNFPLGHPKMLTGIEGSTTIFVVAKEAGECEALGTEVFTNLMQYSNLIQNEFGFAKFKLVEYGGLSRLDEAAEYFVIPVVIAYAVVDTWQIVQESPLLKGFSTDMNTGS
jgi:hypothetical protein